MKLQRILRKAEPEENGQYYGFSEKHELWAMNEWVLLTDIQSWLQSIKQLLFFNETSRIYIRESFWAITRHRNLFSAKKRFPANGYYVYLCNSPIGRAIDNVLQALEISDQSTDLHAIKKKYEILLFQLGELIYDNKGPQENGILSRRAIEGAPYFLYWINQNQFQQS